MTSLLDPYPSPEQRDDRLARLTDRLGGERVTYGQSVEGRPLVAARIPQAGAGGAAPRARLLSTGNIHGLEYVSGQVVLGLLDAADRLDSLRRLRERAELWFIPCLNPDGYARAWQAGGVGDLRSLRTNAHGVDLNRNFPLPAGERRASFPGAGSPRAGARTYRGQAPLSEPETRALAELLGRVRFDAGTNGHSFMGRLIPPRVRDRDDFRAYAELCRRFGDAQPHTRYPRLASRFIDTFTGELEDYQHHVHRTWAVCVETFSIGASFAQHLRAPSLFWRFNPHAPARWIENDVAGIAGFFHAALDTTDDV
jgi:hypothetical protein